MDMVNIGAGTAGIVALLGYAVVFVGIIVLLLVVILMSRVMILRHKRQQKKALAAVQPEPAPGTAGQLKLYDTDPRTAAMIMAIVADTLGKPINELRFISIREVKEDEI